MLLKVTAKDLNYFHDNFDDEMRRRNPSEKTLYPEKNKILAMPRIERFLQVGKKTVRNKGQKGTTV